MLCARLPSSDKVLAIYRPLGGKLNEFWCFIDVDLASRLMVAVIRRLGF